MAYIVEYDTEYWGGDYSGCGSETEQLEVEDMEEALALCAPGFRLLPGIAQEALGGSLEAFAIRVAFTRKTSLPWEHIVSYRESDPNED